MLKFNVMMVLAVGVLSSCANMNKDDCLTADWNVIGFEDGVYGRNQSNISSHRKDCAKHGVTPDLNAYREGHFEGSRQFCTKDNGFFRGRDGENYGRNCPEEFEQDFLSGFADGQTLYALQEILNRQTEKLERVFSQIETIEHLILEKKELMIADGLNREQRKLIRDEIEYHEHELFDLRELLPELQHDYEASAEEFDKAVERFSSYL